MAYVSSVIGALRGGAPVVSGAPTAAAAPTGVSFLNPTQNTAAPASMPSTVSALRKNNAYALNDPTMLSMPAGVMGGNDKLFTKGQGLNEAYGAAFKQETDMAMPDMRLHGTRYEGEVASPLARRNLANAITLRNANVGAGEIYKGGDFDLLPGMSMDMPEGRAAFNQYMGGGENNSMFVPDKIEVDPGYWYNLPADAPMSRDDRQRNWDQSYYGGRMLSSGNATTGVTPEWQLRNLMTRDAKLAGDQTPESRDLLTRIYQENRAPLIAMDIGRGGLTPDQADALNRATEYSGYLRALGPANDSNARARSLYESELAKYMGTVDQINMDGADYSSMMLLRALRGG